MKVAICTLGCKVNQYETQALEQELLHRGHELVDFEETADAYVVNTCSVTAVSDKKSRQMLRQAQRRNPSAVIAACGCYAQTHPEDVKKLGLDVIAGTNDRAKFIDLLERAAQDKTPIVDVDDVWERRDFEVLPAGGMVNRTRAMLKVEDGCVNFCTYCLIPYARGRVRSLPMDEAAKQVKALREEGYREITLRPFGAHRARGRRHAHPPRLARTADHHGGILQAGVEASLPLPTFPPLDAVGLRRDLKAYEPQI